MATGSLSKGMSMLHLVSCSRTVTRVGDASGQVQLVVTPDYVLVDVQGRERGVDGVERANHGTTILNHAQALVLRNALSQFLAARRPGKAAA